MPWVTVSSSVAKNMKAPELKVSLNECKFRA